MDPKKAEVWYETARIHFSGIISLLVAPADAFFNRGKAVRRIVLFACLWMLWRAGTWCAAFSDQMLTMERSGAEIAAIWAAVFTPLSALVAGVFKFYNDGRTEEEPPKV